MCARKKNESFSKAIKILGVSIPGTPSLQGKIVKLGNLDEVMLELRSSLGKKGEVFLEFSFLPLFLLHADNKGKVREILRKALEKLL